MRIRELLQLINHHIPFAKAEDWDNVGLLIGDKDKDITGILTTLDCTLEVVKEAAEKNCNTIIAHHPLIFSGIKRIENTGYGAVMHALIKNDINLIAMHTNLDAYNHGVSAMIADKIGMTNQQILLPGQQEMAKLQVFVPEAHADALKSALSEAGVGQIGDYSDCFFQLEGKGQFKPNEQANPFTGKRNKLEIVDELKLECVFQPERQAAVEEAVHAAHPYEEPAYDIYRYKVKDTFGTGIKGELEGSVVLKDWLPELKAKLGISTLKLIGDIEKEVRTIGIISGAGVSYGQDVKHHDIDLFLTGDIKYHEAHDLLMMGLTTADIEHYSENVMKEGLKELLESITDELSIQASTVSTDPFTAI